MSFARRKSIGGRAGFAPRPVGDELIPMRPAFLGLGAIGRPMAARVAAAYPSLTVWNRTASRAQSFATESGAHAAETPAEAVRDADSPSPVFQRPRTSNPYWTVRPACSPA